MYIAQAYKSKHEFWLYLLGIGVIFLGWQVFGAVPLLAALFTKSDAMNILASKDAVGLMSEVLVKGDLRGIVRARRLSHAVMNNIRQNLFFAFVYNSLGVPVAAGVLYPVFGLLLSPIIAATAMSFSSLSVVGNALRLRKAG